jgi:hypothetical protein
LHFDQLRPWVSLLCNLIDVAKPPWPLTSPTSLRKSNFPGETFGRNQRNTPVEAQQPNATPDDAFRFLGCTEALQDSKNAQTRLETLRRLLRTKMGDRCRIEMWAYA